MARAMMRRGVRGEVGWPSEREGDEHEEGGDADLEGAEGACGGDGGRRGRGRGDAGEGDGAGEGEGFAEADAGEEAVRGAGGVVRRMRPEKAMRAPAMAGQRGAGRGRRAERRG